MTPTAPSAAAAATNPLRIVCRPGSTADVAQSLRFTFEGQIVEALQGDSIAMALWAAGIKHLRTSPTAGTARGVFCAMGSCQECAVRVDGVVKLACNTPARAGLDVTAFRGTIGQPS